MNDATGMNGPRSDGAHGDASPFFNPPVDEDTPFDIVDDEYHLPADDDPTYFETTWWSFAVPERRIGGWLHAGRSTNRGLATWRVFVWDPSGADPGRLPYFKIMTDVPFGDGPRDIGRAASPDLRDVTFPQGGFSVRMLRPRMDYHIRYGDPENRFGIEFEHRSVHAPHRFTPGEAPALHNPHFDQLGHVTGELVLDGERIELDCWSVRDRTWGPRSRAHSHNSQPNTHPGERSRVLHPGGPSWRMVERERGRQRIQYIFGHHRDRTGFLSFVRIQDGDRHGWSPLNVGWLLKDGVFERLDKKRSRMRNFRDPKTGWSSHMQIELVDRTGRTLDVEGVALSSMCESGAGANSSFKWHMFDGETVHIGWGEDQDIWRADHFARMVRELRGYH